MLLLDEDLLKMKMLRWSSLGLGGTSYFPLSDWKLKTIIITAFILFLCNDWESGAPTAVM